MPRCKICGEDVRAGTVLHLSCMEELEKELKAMEEALCLKSDALAERERELDMREFELDVRDGYLETWYEEIISTEKQAKRLLASSIAVAAFNVVVAMILIIAR